jgi:hypothetical protein
MVDWTEKRRREAEASGHTFEGTRYPIESCADVSHAAADLHHSPASEQPAIRRYIARRAAELGCPLPEGWKVRMRRGH